jgi:hypothetical protein
MRFPDDQVHEGPAAELARELPGLRLVDPLQWPFALSAGERLGGRMKADLGRSLQGGAMSKPEPNGKRQDDDRWADVRNRFGDIYKENPENARRSGRWATLRDRLGIAAVILALAVLGFMMVDGSIVNFRCTFAEFITFECNRWAGEEHPSLRR